VASAKKNTAGPCTREVMMDILFDSRVSTCTEAERVHSQHLLQVQQQKLIQICSGLHFSNNRAIINP